MLSAKMRYGWWACWRLVTLTTAPRNIRLHSLPRPASPYSEPEVKGLYCGISIIVSTVSQWSAVWTGANMIARQPKSVPECSCSSCRRRPFADRGLSARRERTTADKKQRCLLGCAGRMSFFCFDEPHCSTLPCLNTRKHRIFQLVPSAP